MVKGVFFPSEAPNADGGKYQDSLLPRTAAFLIPWPFD
jgi:hypothetical protein